MTTHPVPTGRRRIAGERVRGSSEAPASNPTITEQTQVKGVRPSWVPPRWLMTGLAIALAGAVAFDVVVMARLHTPQGDAETSAAATTSAFNTAPAQAEKAAEALLSYDYATLQADADAAKPYLTAAYSATFQRTVDNFLARPAEQSRGDVSAEVMASGVVSATATEVEVLLFVDQTSKVAADRGRASGSAASTGPQTALNRVVLSMVKTGDDWLVDDVTAL